MSVLDKVGIRVAPFSNRIVLARFGKSDPTLALETKDAMSEFLKALVQYVGVDNELSFGGGDERFILTLRKAPTASTQVDAAS